MLWSNHITLFEKKMEVVIVVNWGNQLTSNESNDESRTKDNDSEVGTCCLYHVMSHASLVCFFFNDQLLLFNSYY